MKHSFVFLWVFLCIIFLLPIQSQALPKLQLDISDGIYIENDSVFGDGGNESIQATSEEFTLYALLSDTNYLDQLFFISAAIIPRFTAEISDLDLGSFTFDGETVNVTSSGMDYGRPQGIAPHGVFSTYYIERSFYFNESFTAAAYNSQDDPGGLVPATSGNLLYYQPFTINTGNLAEGYAVHFDLYSRDATGQINLIAPYSHDAQSGVSKGNPIPETSAAILLGIALVGLLVTRKVKRQS